MNECHREAGSAVSIETPSGKDVAYENFPVGSWFLSNELRPHIAMFYRFARTIDDIADNPNLSVSVKVERLEGFEMAILGSKTNPPQYSTGLEMRNSLLTTRVTLQHSLDLIYAFKQDAVKCRYANWSELMMYCYRSAAPVGRYLLDLHGESKVGYGPSDALCNVLQVINHLQDCQEDYRQLNRVYLPLDWCHEVGAEVEALDAVKASPRLRYLFNRCLDALEPLMLEARKLPGVLANRRLAMEAAAIVCIAERLIAVLRHRDPLSSRLQLNKLDYIWQSLRGITPVFLGFGRL